MSITAREFNYLVEVLRIREPNATAARLVLLDGKTNVAAASKAGASSPQAVHRATKRIVEERQRVLKVFRKSLVSSST